MGRRIVSGLFAALWGYLAYVGFGLTEKVVARRVPGYPSAGQWHFYVLFPAAMLLLGAAIALLPRRLPTTLYVGLLTIEIMPVIPFLLVYGGGM
jgi:hypothetical protein